jgi:hypothetical protein
MKAILSRAWPARARDASMSAGGHGEPRQPPKAAWQAYCGWSSVPPPPNGAEAQPTGNPEGIFAESGLPLVRTLEINGYQLYHPRRLAKRLKRSGSLTAARAQEIAGVLSRRLPAA